MRWVRLTASRMRLPGCGSSAAAHVRLQSVAQVSSTYGQGDAHTIVENCGNTLILRCSASEGGGTSRFASRLIGEREVLRTTQCRTRRASEWMGSASRSEQFSTELALLPSEIEQLPDLDGLLKVASRPEWLRVSLKQGALQQSSPAAADSRTTAVQPRARQTPQQKGPLGREQQCARAPPEHAAELDCDAPSFDRSHRSSGSERRSYRMWPADGDSAGASGPCGHGARETGAHTHGLDAVVREEIRRTLVEELQTLVSETAGAARALRALGRVANLRTAAWSVGIATLSSALALAMIVGAARKLLPSPSEIAALSVQREELAAASAPLSRAGVTLTCGSAALRSATALPASRAPSRSSRIWQQGDYLVVAGY